MQGVEVHLPREEVLTKEHQCLTGDQSGAAHLFWPVLCLALSCSAAYISDYIKGTERNRYWGGKKTMPPSRMTTAFRAKPHPLSQGWCSLLTIWRRTEQAGSEGPVTQRAETLTATIATTLIALGKG